MEDHSFERRAGLTIAVFAAILAINDLLGDKFGDDEILGANERANAFAWFQSKSTKQALVQNQLALVELLPDVSAAGLTAAAYDPSVAEARRAQVEKWKEEVARYAREKEEILEGSAAVGPENWALEDDSGERGHIYGANRWTATLHKLETAGDRFDLGSLFLQLTLVLGAVSLVAQEGRLKSRYYWGMVTSGLVGTCFLGWGFVTAVL